MGYSMQQAAAQFTMVEGAKYDALRALRAAADNRYSWVDPSQLREARTLEEVVDAWGWKLKTDYETGAVVGIHFEAEKPGDDGALFAILAPFVRAGSYIEMTGEEGERWRWLFDGTTVRTVKPRIVWAE